MARPTKYDEWLTEDGLLKIKGWARDRATNKDIAHNIGVSYETLNDWSKKFPQLSDAIKKGREPILVNLEDSMLSRTEWKQVEEETEEIFVDSNGKKSKKNKIVKKWIPPDTAMMIFLAKNYMPKKYRDKPVYDDSEEYEDSGLLEQLSKSVSDEDMRDDFDLIEGDDDE